MLKTECNTGKMGARIMRAFHDWCGCEVRASAAFDHGQWWVTRHRDQAQWSVIDAEGGPSVDGFDFELVSYGDDAA